MRRTSGGVILSFASMMPMLLARWMGSSDTCIERGRTIARVLLSGHDSAGDCWEHMQVVRAAPPHTHSHPSIASTSTLAWVDSK